jgi:hypothetical protein
MSQAEYEVRVAGSVGDEDLADIGAVSVSATHVDTVLYGVSDESALYGLLARLRALGLEVVEVRRVSPVPGSVEDQSGETPEPGDGG